ncbi:formate dehydrogenase subunit delta [Nitrogeniibacter mangrovi]|uniref:Formate dehydrogenase subunit delta n=1 Tax=Nitrogeniibacter mangrovi TaxID=2016596 RepID=A0A6C1B4K3_9RHOO|nr:formate dehydrogenase subunit delta [Nitrogeniibacter mangrovi]QID17939.1 formate dehydrogenase subunit delta [Nitrogeniibacter mangrovi]
MDIQHLVKMANQIGQFFASYPDHDEARRSIGEHLKKFWAPAMRKALAEHLASTGEQSGLEPLVAEAVRASISDQIGAGAS